MTRRAPDRVMVLTLASDEPQLAACTDMVERQSVVGIAHRTITGLGNVEAHTTLYRAVEAEADRFDLFLKIDADMVLASTDTVRDMVTVFQEDPDLDHVVFTVHDWFTDRDIFGLHAFSHRCTWPVAIRAPFVDPSPAVTGRARLVAGPPAPVAAHAPDPSEDQAWAFGVHRGLKIAQPGESPKRASYVADHWNTMLDVADHYRRSGDERLLIALAGAVSVLDDADGSSFDYRSSSWTGQSFGPRSSPGEMLERAERIWSSPMLRRRLRARALGVRGEARASALEALRRTQRSRREEGGDGG